MATKLFVGKLSFDTTNDTLEALFATYGKVISAQVIIDRGTNQSKGFGFVEMEDQTAAQAAINALDGKEFEGRVIVVNVARPKEDRPYGGGGGGGFSSGFQRRN
ncbi:MAG TPA: RNA-binding protein [Candidatus Saccharimonadales bacterium]|nr:RNA-binding protein [Candidatus Saccharimonadales bacterium]